MINLAAIFGWEIYTIAKITVRSRCYVVFVTRKTNDGKNL